MRRRARVVAGLSLGLLASIAPAAEPDLSRRLIVAAARGDAAGVRALLRQGADPDRGDAAGWTALHQAAEQGDSAIVGLLLRSGASPDLRARVRGTALDVAETAGRPEIARALRAAGARGSGKSTGDGVCVRPWAGEGYCAVVLGRDPTHFDLRLTQVVGCEQGCAADPTCSGGKPVGPGGLATGDRISVPASCLTHTGLR